MQFFIPKNIKFVLDTLHKSGYSAFLVGGCVRDMLLGNTPHDFDITTSALPHEVESLFERTVSTGIKHGTITVITDGTPVEVTTFRTESGYSDCRRPDKVEFVTDIKYDLSRRDFTVNAMAYNEYDGLIDLFGGKADLKNGVLKAVGDVEKRFEEDALRILRLYRFASVLSFKIDPLTEKGAIKFIDSLKNVSPERIFTELIKAVCGDNTHALTPFIKSGGLKFLNIENCENLNQLSRLNKSSALRLFSFLYLCKADVKGSLDYLKASNYEKKYCLNLLELSKSELPKTKSEIKGILRKFGREVYLDYLTFTSAILNEETKIQRELFGEIEKNGEPYLIGHLSVDGNDLKALNIQGKEISDTLNLLVLEVSKNPTLNTKENLINLCLEKRN
jgi:tRNA nucleotidyltransferase (CCA-adding enzyme)